MKVRITVHCTFQLLLFPHYERVQKCNDNNWILFHLEFFLSQFETFVFKACFYLLNAWVNVPFFKIRWSLCAKLIYFYWKKMPLKDWIIKIRFRLSMLIRCSWHLTQMTKRNMRKLSGWQKCIDIDVNCQSD